MIHGPAGLVTIAPEHERPRYIKQDRKVLFPNGAYAICFSAEQPERLRGPQCEAAWCDEIAAWRYVDQTWDMMSFGLRLGKHPLRRRRRCRRMRRGIGESGAAGRARAAHPSLKELPAFPE
jgi:phage terminase large subunit-like protein